MTGNGPTQVARAPSHRLSPRGVKCHGTAWAAVYGVGSLARKSGVAGSLPAAAGPAPPIPGR